MNKDKAYVEDVLNALRSVVAYQDGMSYEVFAADAKTVDAIHRQLEIMGEAAKRLTPALRDAHPEIPWKKMAGMRDKLIHGYDEIEPDQVYTTVTQVIPPLIPKVEALLNSMPDLE